jgi:hypothetical protein
VEVVAVVADGYHLVLPAAGNHYQSAFRPKSDEFDPVVRGVGVGTATAPKVQLLRTLEIHSAACGASWVSPFAQEHLDNCIAFHWAILTGAAVRFAGILSEVPMGCDLLSSARAWPRGPTLCLAGGLAEHFSP